MSIIFVFILVVFTSLIFYVIYRNTNGTRILLMLLLLLFGFLIAT